MNKLIIYGFLIIALIYSCNYNSDKTTPAKIIGAFYDGLNKSDFNQVESCISDSLLFMEGGFVLTKNIREFYVLFQWDTVFSPKFSIINSRKISDNTIEVTVSKLGKRIKFLNDSAIVYKAKFDFANNQITKLDHCELVIFDTLKWNSRRDTLVAWIKTNYPDLDGFVYDQTLTGAQHYLEAIELYKNRK